MLRITPTPSYQSPRPVKSETTAGLTYLITVKSDGRLHCPCIGFSYRQTCRHLKALAGPVPVVAAPITHSVNCDLYGFTGDCAVCS